MKNKWTKIEAVDWLKKQLAMGESETVEKFKEDKFWREIYRRAPVKIQPYLQLRFFKAVNPELEGEREVFFQELLHETESAMRARDWNWLRVKTAGRAFVPERAIRAKL